MKIPFQLQTLEDYQKVYTYSIENPEAFWAEMAQNLHWHRPWEQVLEWDFSNAHINWFKGGQLNVAENCLDVHLENKAQQTALIWESNNPAEQSRSYTYQELYDAVVRMALVLKDKGIQKGDRVCIYMGMIPELPIAMLACARIGAVHSVIFAGFSAQSIADRVKDAQAKMIITCDGAVRGTKQYSLKDTIDEALLQCTSVESVIVYQRTYQDIYLKEGRDVLWQDAMDSINDSKDISCPPVSIESEDMLFILYTSGSTGKPKGVVHTSAGYLLWAKYTFANVFQYQPNQIHFCTADIGWITGHTYTVYGPLSNGATVIMYEGVPAWPDAGRLWDMVAKHKANILYTAPTAIRSLMAKGNEWLDNKDLSSLRVLGTVGEPINEEAWHWYDEKIGRHQLPIVDTWWQTETGGIMISNLANVTPGKPTYATLPLPGIQPCLVDDKGNVLEENEVIGNLCIRFPWPGMIRTTYGDHDRCIQTYFSTYPGYYFTGDGCYRNEDGLYKITGRVDDVLNVSGHRIGTAEVENAIDSVEGVVESAIVGYPHDVKGQGIYAFVTYNGQEEDEAVIKGHIQQAINLKIGAIARPDKIQIVADLPKTRSGKIMRRLLRKIAEGALSQLGDTSTLLDPTVMDAIIKGRIQN